MDSHIDLLIDQVFSPDDYEMAADALAQLASEQPKIAARVAHRMLRERLGDQHLLAFAFNILYSKDRRLAWEYIQKNHQTEGIHVFAAMLTEIAEDVGLREELAGLEEIVELLAREIKARHRDDLKAIGESVSLFLEAYKPRN